MQVLFCLELTVASLVRSGYFASLYFWIDLAATLSMLLDITSLMDLIFQQSTMAGHDAFTRPDQNKVPVFLRLDPRLSMRIWHEPRQNYKGGMILRMQAVRFQMKPVQWVLL